MRMFGEPLQNYKFVMCQPLAETNLPSFISFVVDFRGGIETQEYIHNSYYINCPLFLLNTFIYHHFPLIPRHCQNEIFKYFEFCYSYRIVRIACYVDAFLRLFKFE